MPPPHHDQRQAALAIVKALHAGGHVALFAGGCVRDVLLSREPKDYDVATDATPQRVMELFPRARMVGAQFGVILVRRYGHDVEVATFRTDGVYLDGRHPEDVTFGTQQEDARRRDFTINGLFLDPIGDRIIDDVGGRADLEAGILRTIGDPDHRFSEDHLRMLRAIRFASRLGFVIDADTQAAIERNAACLSGISSERVWMELGTILSEQSRATGWSLLVATGLRDHLVAGWHGDVDSDERSGRRLGALPARPIPDTLGLAAVLVSQNASGVARVCRTLRLSNRQAGDVAWLLTALPRAIDEAALDQADLKELMAHEAWPGLMQLVHAELVATERSVQGYERLAGRARAIPADCVAPSPLVTGDELIERGMTPGPDLGKILRWVYRAQLNDLVHSKNDATKMAQKLWSDRKHSEE